MARERFVGELSDCCVGTSFVLTSFPWRRDAVTRLSFNGGVVGDLDDSCCRTIKERIVSTPLFPDVVWFDS